MIITFVCSLSLLLNIIGLSIPYWFISQLGEDGYIHGGLWKACIKSADINTCESYDTFKTTIMQGNILKTVRAMELLGMLSCVATLILVVNKEFNIKIPLIADQRFGKSDGIVGLIAGGFMLIGVIVFAAGKHILIGELASAKLHAGFGLCVISGVLSIASGVISFLIKPGRNTTSNTV